MSALLRRLGVLSLATGCGEVASPPPPPPAPLLVAREATLHAPGQGLMVHAAQATVEDVGTGSARQVQAQAGGLEITSLRSVWSFSDRSVTFQGEVVAIRGDATLRCETLTVVMGAGEQIREARAEGGVIVEQQGRRAAAARASLEGATGQVLLEGQPSLSEAGRRLEGHRILLWLDDARVECTSSAEQRCRITLEGEAIGRPAVP